MNTRKAKITGGCPLCGAALTGLERQIAYADSREYVRGYLKIACQRGCVCTIVNEATIQKILRKIAVE